jgi:membrane protein implicated in regulation of membrane protease activity
MLFHIISRSEIGSVILVWIEYAALVIEILAVAIIIIAISVALERYLVRHFIRRTGEDHYHQLKVSLGQACCWAWRFWWRSTSCGRWRWN